MKNNHVPRMPQDYPPARHIHFVAVYSVYQTFVLVYPVEYQAPSQVKYLLYKELKFTQ
jgi:hypothetical protein